MRVVCRVCVLLLCTGQVEQVVDDNWGRLSSFVQLRASIPVFWSQIGNIATPKPPILLGPVDPTFKAAQYACCACCVCHAGKPLLQNGAGVRRHTLVCAWSYCRLHFAETMTRYGSPILVLNLVRGPSVLRGSKLHPGFRAPVGCASAVPRSPHTIVQVKKNEKKPRESLIGSTFGELVRFLNTTLPCRHRIQYFPLDYSALVRAPSVPACLHCTLPCMHGAPSWIVRPQGPHPSPIVA